MPDDTRELIAVADFYRWLVAAAALVALVVVAKVAGAASFEAFPSLAVPVGAAELALCASLLVAALLPFADRRGIAP